MLHITFGPITLELGSPELDQLQNNVKKLRKDNWKLRNLIQQSLSKENTIMQEFDDLKAAITTLNTNDASEQQTADAILTLLRTNPSSAEVAAITAQVQKVASNEAARTGALQAALDAAKAPAPTTSTGPSAGAPPTEGPTS